MIVYKCTNKTNNNIYIGITKHTLSARKSQHLYSAAKNSPFYFHRALRKYSSKNFNWEVIDTATSLQELKLKEYYYIGYYLGVSCVTKTKLYNSKFDNTGYHTEISKEVRAKKSKSMLGKNKGSKNGMFGKTGKTNPAYGSGDKIRCHNNNKIYISSDAAEKDLGVLNVRAVASGKRECSKKYFFSFVDSNKKDKANKLRKERFLKSKRKQKIVENILIKEYKINLFD